MIGQTVVRSTADVLEANAKDGSIGIRQQIRLRKFAAEIQKPDVGLGRANGNPETAIDPPSPPRDEDMHKEQPPDAVDVDL